MANLSLVKSDITEKLLEYLEFKETSFKKRIQGAVASFHEAVFEPLRQSGKEDEIEEILGEDDETILYASAIENFFINKYPDEKNPKLEWNFIDDFLACEAERLSEEEIEYAKAYKDSYLSIYHVIKINAEEGKVSLLDALDLSKKDIRIKTPEVLKCLLEGDIISARLLEPKNYPIELCENIFLADSDAFRELIDHLRNIIENVKKSKQEKSNIAFINQELKNLFKNTDMKQIRQSFSIEIMSTYLETLLEKSKQTSKQTPFNCNGHELKNIDVNFRIQCKQKDLIRKLEETQFFTPSKNKKEWVYLKDIEDVKWENLDKYKDKSDFKDEVLEVELQDGSPKEVIIFADLVIDSKTLIVSVNSKERAVDMKYICLSILKDCISFTGYNNSLHDD